jgi:membrane protease YdiL (CAAX protease family)
VSALDVAARPVRSPETAAYVVGFGAAVFLLIRSAIAPLGAPALASGYLALGAASLWVAGSSTRPRAREQWIPLAVGLASVLLVRAAAGAAPPVPFTVAIVALNSAAAFAEEAFFRGFLFGRLEPWGIGPAISVSALAFAAIHLPLYGWSAFPVDLGAGLLFSWQRAASGTCTTPCATHALANLLAVLR